MSYLERTKLTDANGTVVTPASEEAIVLLRRMVKLLESQNATDIGNRQRITIDAITGALTLGTVTTVGTVTAVTGITNALPAGTNTLGNVTVGGADQRQFIDMARTAYNTGIRSKLTFN